MPESPPPERDPAIAVLVDTSSTGIMAMAAAVAAAAARRNVRVRAMRVPSRDEPVDESTAALEALVARARSAYPEVAIDPEIVTGRPVRVLADVSAEVGLVVVGARVFGRDGALALGSVRKSLLGMARCPVMIVPARLASAGRARRRVQAEQLAANGSSLHRAAIGVGPEPVGPRAGEACVRKVWTMPRSPTCRFL